MTQQTAPWIEGAYGWNFGESGWNTGMDNNLLKFSFMFDRNVDSITASLPAAVNGQAHYLTTDNRLYFAVGTTYFSTSVPKWFTVVLRSSGNLYQFNGTSLVQIDSPAQVDARLDAVETTITSLGTAAFQNTEFFATQAALDVAVAPLQQFDSDIQALNGSSLVGWQRTALADQITKVNQVLSTNKVNIWEYASLVVTRPTPNDPSTWDWSPAVSQAFIDLEPVGELEFTPGTFKFSGVSTTKTISIIGAGAGSTVLRNYTAGATMLSYTQVGMSDKERRNWLRLEGFSMFDEASFTGIGIKTDGVLSILMRDTYIREFKTNYGFQCLEALWVHLENVNTDLCELNFVSVAVPHNNNVISIKGGELRNPTAGRSSIYVETADIVSLQNVTIEGNTGGPGYISGGKFKGVKMLGIDNTYFEVLSSATEAALVIENCQAVDISKSQLNSQSSTVPSVLLNGSSAVKFSECAMVTFPIRANNKSSFTLEKCLVEGPMDISSDSNHRVISTMPYNTRAVIVTDPKYQVKTTALPKAFANSYSDSSFETAAPSVTSVAGAPVSSHDTTQGYYGTRSWRVTGVNGDSIRANNLGVTTANGQSGCFTFMAKADTAGRFTLLNFLSGASGGHDIYLSTEWRRYFTVTNLDPTNLAGDSFLLQLTFTGTNAFNMTDIQFIPFTEYKEIPAIIDGFNYIPTHGTSQTTEISRNVEPSKVFFDRSVNLRRTTLAPTLSSGDIHYADGTTWNPGAGEGLYFHRGSTTLAIPGTLAGSATYDPPSLADGAGVTTTVTVTGAALGDFAMASFSLDLQGITVTAYVSSTNTVSVRFQNESGGVLDLASGTLRVRVIKL